MSIIIIIIIYEPYQLGILINFTFALMKYDEYGTEKSYYGS